MMVHIELEDLMKLQQELNELKKTNVQLLIDIRELRESQRDATTKCSINKSRIQTWAGDIEYEFEVFNTKIPDLTRQFALHVESFAPEQI